MRLLKRRQRRTTVSKYILGGCRWKFDTFLGNEDKTVGSTPPTHEPVSDNAHIEQEIERLSAKASEIRKMLDSVSEQRNQNVLESGSETPSTSESLDARSNYSDCV
eukprot:GHVQ01026946.1.p2 GENE.GHVQ01026946.1~~GHVQ01026946.1.p2  ORF type:complete len:106 (+),score=14.08 GHVQ01026946.1:704-1021(+)